MQRSPATTIIAVDLLRFVCALLVVVYHLDAGYWLAPSDHAAAVLADVSGHSSGLALPRVGWVGVELFFVISGLVIARSAVDATRADFLRRRVLRLVPAAWVCATLSLAVLATSRAAAPSLITEWANSVLFWPNGRQIDGSYWTLGIECFFYLAVMLAIGNRGKTGRIEAVCLAIGAVSAGLWFASLAWPHAIMPIMIDRSANLLLAPHGLFFALGVLIGGADSAGWRPWRQIAVAVLGMAAAIEIRAHAGGLAATMLAPVSGPLAIGVFAVGIAWLIAAPRLQAPLSRWITPATARTIGVMTYPLYLIHQDAGAVLIARLLGDRVPLIHAQIATAVLVLAMTWWVAAFAEPAVRGLLARTLMPRRGPAPDNRPTAFPSGG